IGIRLHAVARIVVGDDCFKDMREPELWLKCIDKAPLRASHEPKRNLCGALCKNFTGVADPCHILPEEFDVEIIPFGVERISKREIQTALFQNAFKVETFLVVVA